MNVFSEPDDQIDPEDQSVSRNSGNSLPSLLEYSDHVFRWRSMKAPILVDDCDGNRNDFTLPPTEVDEMTPLNYFELFWKPDLNEHIADQTNLYAMQTDSTMVSTTKGEIKQFIGMQMLMAIVPLPTYEMYWANDTRYAPIADVMGRNRYKPLRRYLHVNDNSLLDDEARKKQTV